MLAVQVETGDKVKMIACCLSCFAMSESKGTSLHLVGDELLSPVDPGFTPLVQNPLVLPRVLFLGAIGGFHRAAICRDSIH